MQIKLLCNCGTKFTFDVEPVDGRMPSLALCPNCQVDCTEVADAYIAQVLSAAMAAPAPMLAPAPVPPPAPVSISVPIIRSAPAPAPVTAPVPPPPPPSAPMTSGSGLKVSRAHAVSAPSPTPPQPAPSPSPAAAPAPTAPKASGLSVSRRAHEPAAAEPAASAVSTSPVATKAEEKPAEDESFEARRARRLAEAQGKQAATHAEWGKTLKVIRMAAVFLILFAGFWGWYSFIGSAPALYYEVPTREGDYSMTARLFSPDELVVVDAKGVSMHDLKTGQKRWTFESKKGGGEGDEDEDRWSRSSGESHLHVTAKDIWALQSGKLVQLEAATGKVQKEIPVAGSVSEFTPTDENLVIVSQNRGRQYHLMAVNLGTGEAKTETIGSPPKEKVVAQVKSNFQRPATSGNLLKQELEGDDEQSLFSKNTLFAAAGDHAVRIDVKVTKTNITRVKVMRDAPKKSKLNSNTSIMSDPGAIAEDVFNDIKRSDGGQFQNIDLSTYQLTIKRLLKGEESTWQGEVSGEPAYYSGKTVDLVVGHQEIIILSKGNKQIAKQALKYPTGSMGGLSFRRRENQPFLETKNALYFWDQGTITAFDLSTGEKKWDYENVGITSVAADEDDGLYVCGTTASPDSIQFSEDVNINDRPRAKFFKLDARSGKLEWDCKEGAKDVYLTGKFLYITRGAGSTLGLMAGDSGAGHTYVYRVNPGNGKIDWEMDHKGDIDELSVYLNRLAIVSEGSVRVMKFLSL